MKGTRSGGRCRPVSEGPLIRVFTVRFAWLALTIFVVGCGGGSNPVAPSPPLPVQIGGSWSGTLESFTYATMSVVATINQAGSTISGTWWTTDAGVPLAGAMNGTVDRGTFTGTITLSVNQRPSCQGAFSGSATLTSFNWSSPGFTGDCGFSAPGNPIGPRFVMQRRQ